MVSGEENLVPWFSQKPQGKCHDPIEKQFLYCLQKGMEIQPSSGRSQQRQNDTESILK